MTRKILEGTVVSDIADKTVSVLVRRTLLHPLYKKRIKRSRKYLAHDPLNIFKIGDKVLIQEHPPFSRRKAFKVIYKEESNNDI